MGSKKERRAPLTKQLSKPVTASVSLLAGASPLRCSWGQQVVEKLERLRDEREQVQFLLRAANVNPDARHILEALLHDLDREIDEELTRRLSPHSDSGSRAAD